MKRKRLLKFYFSAERLNRALDNIITEYALRSAEPVCGGEYYAEKICAVIRAKRELSLLWKYLDEIIGEFSVKEMSVLRFYGLYRSGTANLSEDGKRELKRVLMKFSRRLRNMARYEEGMRLIGEYFSLM